MRARSQKNARSGRTLHFFTDIFPRARGTKELRLGHGVHRSVAVVSWYLYQMVTQYMLRMHEGIWVFSGKNTRFEVALM